MDATATAILARSILAALLIIGGILALRFGYILYRSGIGLSPDGTTIETGKLKANLKTVGSVVMATSVAWGGLGYLSSPTFTKEGENTTVASISVPPIRAPAPVDITDVRDLTADQLRQSFQQAAKALKINGKPATLVGVSEHRPAGETPAIGSTWKFGDGSNLEIVFVASLAENELSFQPSFFAVGKNKEDRRVW